MNIVNKLTVRHLKENMGRTVVTTLGICVSVAMITAVFVAVFSFLSFFEQTFTVADGYQHAIFHMVQEDKVDSLKHDVRIKDLGISRYKEFKLNKNDIIAGFYDETALNQLITTNYDGKLPKNKNEAAVDESFLKTLGKSYKVGDTMRLETVAEVETVTVTAILHNNLPTSSISVLRGMAPGEENSIENSGELTAYVTLRKCDSHARELIKQIAKSNDIDEIGYMNVLEAKFAGQADGLVKGMFLPMTIVIILIIMVASISLIYNAFSMSLAEKVRYLGMLATVGATKKQKRLSIYFEGFILGLIGIPVGIGAGILGIGITLKAVGTKLVTSGMFNVGDTSGLKMRVVVSVPVIIGIVIVSALTIFLSSFIPARKASMTTPIDALRQNNEIKVKAKKLKVNPLVRKIFGYEGELADKNIKRNGRKSRVITSSICVSIVLFLTVNYFTMMLSQESPSSVMEKPSQIDVTTNYKDIYAFKDEVSKLSGVDKAFCYELDTVMPSAEEEQEVFGDKTLTKQGLKAKKNSPVVSTCYVDKDLFSEICKEHGIDENKYYSNKQRAILLNVYSGKKNAFEKSVVGKSVSNSSDQPENKTEISDLMNIKDDEIASKFAFGRMVTLLMPVEKYSYPESDDLRKSIGIATSKHQEVAEGLDNLSKKYESDENTVVYYNDKVQAQQATESTVFVMRVFIYGFISLITLISVANIINTISTGISSRKKEFAMIKSVGMTPKGFNKMVAFESLLYTVKSLVISLPVSALLSALMYMSVTKEGVADFSLNPVPYIMVVVAAAVLIGSTMLYSVRKLRNDSIVETLKLEIN